jgi:hypothetical protein
LGSHSATGEEWTDNNDDAGTSAEAQAFKRPAPASGYGAIFIIWMASGVDLDERKRPKAALKLFGWATPEGWRQGLRPQLMVRAHSEGTASASVDFGSSENRQTANSAEIVRQIEALETPLALARILESLKLDPWKRSTISRHSKKSS